MRADVLDNTRRIYVDVLRISAGRVDNHDTGVLAARATLLMSTERLTNTERP